MGLGRINLSDLNQLPKADRALLGKLKREQKAEQRAQQAKLVVRKHVDSKTLLTACATVIFGAALMALGLVMTVVGYFDSDLFSSDEPLMVTEEATTATMGEDSSSSPPRGTASLFFADPPKVSWLRFVLKSMQYVGPVLMGVGMFLLIIACVITLESRDRHAQIIQEESTELRRSRRQQSSSAHSQQQRIGAGAASSSSRAERTTEEEQIRENGAASRGRGSPEAISNSTRVHVSRKRTENSRNNESKVNVRAEVHEDIRQLKPSTATTAGPPANARRIGADFSLSEAASSTDAMAEYTFPNARTPLSGGDGAARWKREWKEVPTIDEAVEEPAGKRKLTMRAQPPTTASSCGNSSGIDQWLRVGTGRRKSSSALLAVNRVNTPRGPAPLVRVESLMELSVSGSSPPSSFGTPRHNPTTPADKD